MYMYIINHEWGAKGSKRVFACSPIYCASPNHKRSPAAVAMAATANLSPSLPPLPLTQSVHPSPLANISEHCWCLMPHG